jgi:hypothetical protein
MMRVTYVCFSSVALGLTVPMHHATATAGAAFVWMATVVAAAIGFNIERHERRIR